MVDTRPLRTRATGLFDKHNYSYHKLVNVKARVSERDSSKSFFVSITSHHVKDLGNYR